jgi:hypothetical protein
LGLIGLDPGGKRKIFGEVEFVCSMRWFGFSLKAEGFIFLAAIWRDLPRISAIRRDGQMRRQQMGDRR